MKEEKILKDFLSFINEEISIYGNPAIPGEDMDKEVDNEDYLDDLEDAERERLGITGRETQQDFHKIGREIMMNVSKVSSLTKGHEKELEALATRIIEENFSDVLDGVILDIKFSDNVSNLLGDDEEDSDMDIPVFKEIKDSKLRNKIYKAKIANNIIQGEALNTKRILNLPEVRDELKEILGDKFEEVLTIWNKIADLTAKADWLADIKAKASMMEEDKNKKRASFGGAVKVEWLKDAEDDDNDQEETPDEPEDDDEYYDEFTPKIIARGVDFPMLLHEATKGIVELIAAISLPGMGASPEEIQDAETVKLNVSSFEDEAEDFRTGPAIAADFRDFINSRPNSDFTPNMRLFIFGKMMDDEYMTAEQFIDLFRGILDKSEQAGKYLDKMIKEIIDEIKQDDMEDALDQYGDEQYDDNEDVPDNFLDDLLGKSSQKEMTDDEYYASLSAKELDDEINMALDVGDIDKVKYLRKFMDSVSYKVYSNELKYLKENKRR